MVGRRQSSTPGRGRQPTASGLFLAALLASTACGGTFLLGQVEADESPRTESEDDHTKVRNTLLHYGNYCGPGPELLTGCRPPMEPADNIDTVCMKHDRAWCRCFVSRFEREESTNHPSPLILSSRFLTIPAPIYRWAFDKEFRECIRTADSNMIAEFDRIATEDAFPAWWGVWTRTKFAAYLRTFRWASRSSPHLCTHALPCL